MKKELLTIILVLAMTGISEAEMFYGMKITDIERTEYLKPMIENGEVRLQYDKETMIPDIRGEAEVEDYIIVRIQNHSNFPLQTNYFTDYFYAITKSGAIYQLKQDAINSQEVVNPNTELIWRLHKPNAEIAMIVCDIGINKRNTIVLKPLEE